MAQTIAPRRRSGSPPEPGSLPVSPPIRRRRKWSLALIGTLVTVGSALAFAVLWMNAGDREPVLVVSRRVPAGQVIEAADLSVIRVSTDPGLAPIAGGRVDEVVGLAAATDLVPGTLLTTEHLDQDEILEAGSAVVGIALRGGQLPTGLQPGDRVLIVRTFTPGTDVEGESLGTVLEEGRVHDIGDRDVANGSVIVSLVVDEEVAPDVAGAASAELVSLVLVPADR